jgi:hypothetical protein
LTFREWKRLGSFPDDYVAKDEKIGKYMVGMSVPPRMTEYVARAVIDQWLKKEETNGQARTETAAEQHPNRKGKPKQAAAK